MSVITVQGIKNENELGIILPHEHVLVDIRNQANRFKEASRIAQSDQNVSISNLDVSSSRPFTN